MSMIGNYRRLAHDRLKSLQADPSDISEFLYDEAVPSDEQLDIGKSWHAIHFLLNGDAWGGSGPLFNAVLGGEPLGEDVGYGPARFLDPDAVKRTAAALSEISGEALVAKFDGKALDENKIYPQGLLSREAERDENVSYIRESYENVVMFFKKAAAQNEAILLFLS